MNIARVAYFTLNQTALGETTYQIYEHRLIFSSDRDHTMHQKITAQRSTRKEFYAIEPKKSKEKQRVVQYVFSRSL